MNRSQPGAAATQTESLKTSSLARYSICITNHNSRGTLRDSLDSVLNQIGASFEVVLVDNCSDDGSDEILKEYQKKGAIRLISRKCSRGQGRQIALMNSLGEYIVSHIDMDDIFRPVLLRLIEFYHAKCEGKVMVAISNLGDWSQNITIAPRDLLLKIGGWRDLQYAEDWDLWSRAAKLSRYAWTVFPVSDRHKNRNSRKGFLATLRYRLGRYRDEMRLGREVFERGERISLAQRVAKSLARLSLPFYPSYRTDFNESFSSSDSAYFVS
ncbi:MAG: glycosyltransferase family A protein [Nitrososphaerales archaeon]